MFGYYYPRGKAFYLMPHLGWDGEAEFYLHLCTQLCDLRQNI